MEDHLTIFRREYLHANTWAQRKEGVPLDLLDALNANELLIAEQELIDAAGVNDDWPVFGLAHIKSVKALPVLYSLLETAEGYMQVIIAYAIFKVCGDKDMIGIAVDKMSKLTSEFQIIRLLYLLPAFNDQRAMALLESYYDHKEYLVAYNAAVVLGRSTKKVIERFREQ
jgi:hypothetical protein